jgi:Family of unknown function (DUF6186)
MTWHNVSLGIWALMALVAIGVLMRGRLAGATVIVIWMWLGWHFFAR